MLASLTALLLLLFITGCSYPAERFFGHMYFSRLRWLQSLVGGSVVLGLGTWTFFMLLTRELFGFLRIVGSKILDFGFNDDKIVDPGSTLVSLAFWAVQIGLTFLPTVAALVLHSMSVLCRTALQMLELHVFGDRVMDMRGEQLDVVRDRGTKRAFLPIQSLAAAVVALLVTATMCCLGPQRNFWVDMEQHNIQLTGATEIDEVMRLASGSSGGCVWLFKGDSKADRLFLEEYMKVGDQIGATVKVAAIDCNDAEAFCKRADVHHGPAILIYPGGRSTKYHYRGNWAAKDIVGDVTKRVPDNTVQIGSQKAADQFLATGPSKMKVVLFSDKKAPPTIFKALSSDPALGKIANFGFVRKESSQLVEGFDVKVFPTLVMLTDTQAEYKGEISFGDIKSWVTTRSEI